MKKVLYLGREDKFFQNLKVSFQDNKEILIDHAEPASNLLEIIKTIKKYSPNIILYENELFQHLSPKILSMVRNNPKLKVTFFIALCEEIEKNQPGKHFSLNDVIYFIKGIETEDVEYCIKSLLLPSQAQVKVTPKVLLNDKIVLNQALRVVYLARDHALIESNLDVSNGTILSIIFPYQKEVFKSTKHKLIEKSQTGIVSHFRFNYHLEYQYLTMPLKHDDKNKIVMDMEYDLREKPITTKLYKILEDTNKKPKKLILAQDKIEKPSAPQLEKEKDLLHETAVLASKAFFLNWLIEKSAGLPLFNDTVTVYDPNQTLRRQDSSLLKQSHLNIIERESIEKPAEEILKDRSSLIVICYNKENTNEKISQLINATTQLKDYFPFFLIFNYADLTNEILRDKMAYHFIVATKIDIEETTIQKMLQVFQKKRMDKENNRTKTLMSNLRKKDLDFFKIEENLLQDFKIFKDMDDKDSIFFYRFEVEIVWISEFEIVFKSNHKLNSGDILSTNNSLKIQILIIDHIKDSKESMMKGCYRGIIHFIDEANKTKLRRFINEVTQINSTRESEITLQETSDIKKKYFS